MKSINAKSLAEWTIENRWWIILCSFVLFFISVAGLRFIVVNNDYHVYFSKENPQLIAFDGLQNKYTKDDNVFIMLEPSNGNIFTKENLNAIQELVAIGWHTPYSSRVDGITNFQHMHAVDNDMFVEDLASKIEAASHDDLAKIKNIATHDPLLVNRLVNKEGSVAAVNITVSLPGKTLTENMEVANHVRNAVRNWKEMHPQFQTYLTGNVIFNASFDENFESDMMTLTPLMFGVIILLLYLSTRNLLATATSFLIVLLSMFTGLGLGGWFGIGMSGPVFSAPNMIMTLAIANGIHILVVLLKYMQQGQTKEEAIIESYKINIMPVIITSITTVIGFLTLNLSDTPPFRDLGNITALGVMAALVYSIFLLPALVAALPIKIRPTTRISNTEEKIINGFSDFVFSNRLKLFWVSSLITLLLAYFSFSNELNNQFINFFDRSVSFRIDSDRINDKLTGMYTIEYSLASGEADGISHPQYLRKVEEFEHWFREQPSVVHINAITETIRRINRSMNYDNTSFYQLPETKSEASQFLLLYEMSLPYGLDLNNQIAVDKSESRFTVTVNNITSKELIALAEKGEEWLKKNAPTSMFSNGVSMSLMFSHITKRNMNSMIQGGLVGLVIISFILIGALRSVKFGLISLIPNLSPIAITFGIWAVIDGQINMGISIVFGMVLGIIVDDTIHMLSKYVYARRVLANSPRDAIRYAFSTVAKAAIITTIVLTAGFLVLAQSHFGFNAGMAKVTAITIAIALVLDLILLPSVLLVFDHQRIASEKIVQEEVTVLS